VGQQKQANKTTNNHHTFSFCVEKGQGRARQIRKNPAHTKST